MLMHVIIDPQLHVLSSSIPSPNPSVSHTGVLGS